MYDSGYYILGNLSRVKVHTQLAVIVSDELTDVCIMQPRANFGGALGVAKNETFQEILFLPPPQILQPDCLP